jgi:hypothetical protein
MLSGNQTFTGFQVFFPQSTMVNNMRKNKMNLVLKLYKEGKTTREIAQITNVSLREIGTIISKYHPGKRV